MKKLLKVIVFAVALLSYTMSNAQGSQGESVLTLHAGFSVTGGLIKAVFNDDIFLDSNGVSQTGTSSVSGGPAIVLGYDFGLSDRWSIGAILTNQSWKGDGSNSFINSSGNVQDEVVTFKLNRSNFSLTPKIHYGNGDNVDLYSGVRIGYVFWGGSIESADPDYNGLGDFDGIGRVNIGLTAFGGRFYFNDHFGASFELNLGAPNILGLGLNYKL
ncbi:MAG: opacity protein-like surface antigen [Bacteroidia bacterium]|jgi:opacity protein-like surface antigen